MADNRVCHFCFSLLPALHYLGEIDENLGIECFCTLGIGMYSIVAEHLGIPVNVLIGAYRPVKVYVAVAGISYPLVLLNVVYNGG